MKNITILVLLCLCTLMTQAARAQSVAVVGSLSREATVQPGGKTQGSLLVKNITEQPQTVRLYQTDYLFQADGQALYGELGSVPRSNAAWIAFAPHQVTLAPHESQNVYYTVQVPSDATLTGTYWSLIMVETGEAQPASAPASVSDQPAVAVRQVWRYAVQIITQIGSTGKCDLQFGRRLLTRGPAGASTLQVDLANDGERSLTPQIWAEVFNADGKNLGRFPGRRARLYPGCSLRSTLELGALAPGTYRCLVVADNGDENVFGAQYELDVH